MNYTLSENQLRDLKLKLTLVEWEYPEIKDSKEKLKMVNSIFETDYTSYSLTQLEQYEHFSEDFELESRKIDYGVYF